MARRCGGIVRQVKTVKKNLIIKVDRGRKTRKYVHVFSMPVRASIVSATPSRLKGLIMTIFGLLVFGLGLGTIILERYPPGYDTIVFVITIIALLIGAIGIMLALYREIRLEVETLGGNVYIFYRLGVAPDKIKEEIEKLFNVKDEITLDKETTRRSS